MARRRAQAVQLTLVEEVKAPQANCRRCGRVIRSKVALFVGMGSRCAKLAGYASGPMRQTDMIEGTNDE
jgi:hypothetical protein